MLPFREEGEEKNIIGIKKKEPSIFIKQMVLSLATCKIESCPCGDLHVITAALVVSSFFLSFLIFSKEGGSKLCVCYCRSRALKV